MTLEQWQGSKTPLDDCLDNRPCFFASVAYLSHLEGVWQGLGSDFNVFNDIRQKMKVSHPTQEWEGLKIFKATT